MRGKPIKYHYHTNLQWTDKKKGILKSEEKPEIEVACPPEFGGHPNIWSPEDLFLSSIEVCTMTTFLWFAEKNEMRVASYKSKASGFAELVGNNFQFTKINIEMIIRVFSEEDKKTVKKILKKIPHLCLVSKSVNVDINLNAKILLS